MNNYNIYEGFINVGQISSARELAMRQNTRNPIVETDKNTECIANLNRQQNNILNTATQINKESSETLKYLAKQFNDMQLATSKQFKISLAVSISASIFAFLSFFVALIQCFK